MDWGKSPKTSFYSQPPHLLHLFGRYKVSASAFSWSFQFIPWKTILQENSRKYFATSFPCKIFQGIYFVTLFPYNDRKPTERLSFSTEIQWKKMASVGIKHSIF
jgi:hypothetical protein